MHFKSSSVNIIDGNTAEIPITFVFEPIRHWALSTPDKVAILSSDVAWTYADLEIRTNQIARTLRSRGVAKGDRVSFVLPRGPNAILTLISILKAGAAYVPLDADSPPTRIRECLEDADPVVVLVHEGGSGIVTPDGATVLSIESLLADSILQSSEPISGEELGLDEADLAYIIFTSGSTGRPKGVPIHHAGLTNFVVGDQEVCIRVTSEDRVFQGFSPASDGHHEEVWPTFLAGATLVVASSAEVHSGPELQEFLKSHQVSIVSCAPTLLSMVEEDVPSIRRILFGAENLPMAMVERWRRPGRQIVNTYGPTEATVGATFAYCEPDRPITIGKPLPNYYCYVLDESNRPVPEGGEGQLAIAGVGVSSGYFRRPDLSVGRFMPNPFALPDLQNATMYLTGDRVRLEPDGNIVWLGRIDSQVKIRGHRIELSEIESQILSFSAIKTAVVVTRTNADQELQLAALLVLKEGAEFAIAPFLEQIRAALPAYMVPQSIEIVDRIPMLPSGKIDRKTCQTLRGQQVKIDRELVPPRTPTESMVLGAWQNIFPGEEISCADDFFLDLGGYSLLASRFISFLRSDKGLHKVSVVDVYENPTIRSFAAYLDSLTSVAADRPDFKAVSPNRYRWAKVLQGIGVLGLFGIQALLWLGPIVLAIYFSNNGFTETNSVLLGLAIRAAMVPLVFGLVVILKWAIVGKIKEGRYPLWGGVFLRWWFMGRLLAIAPVGFLTGTPFAGIYLRLLGAKVGSQTMLESMDIDCPDLLTIGDHCNLENSAWLHAAQVTQGELHIHPIKIGNGCTLGVRSGVAGGGVMEEGATLRDLTCVSPGMTVPKGEEWWGSPGRPCADRQIPEYDPDRQPARWRWRLYGVAQLVLILVLTMLESLPFMLVGFTLYNSSEGIAEYVWEPLYAIALVAVCAIQVLIVKWSVMGKLREGTYPYPSFYALRKWFSDKHLEVTSGIIVPVYDSLFARLWCVALGMKCGPRCEIALPRRMPYDLVEMGEESFLASEVSIGMPIRRNGQLKLEKTVVGRRVFLGNDSVVPQGTHVPRESLLGVLSTWPPRSEIGDESRQAWLGSPAFRMPNREVHNQFDVETTYHPTKRLYAERLCHEAFRLVVPSLCSLLVAAGLIEGFVAIWNETSFPVAFLVSPLLYLVGAVVGAVLCRICKWIFVGKYEPTISPLWSPFVWKAETYSAILHDFGVPLFVGPLVGTPFLAWFMRFLGAKVGSRTFINSTDWTETDLIHIGDDVAINANAPLQAHLFEDRVMKVGAIRIGDRCSVGCYSVVLCESELKNDANVGDLSLVMKGETIPSHTFWAGAPVQVGIDPVKAYEKQMGGTP